MFGINVIVCITSPIYHTGQKKDRLLLMEGHWRQFFIKSP